MPVQQGQRAYTHPIRRTAGTYQRTTHAHATHTLIPTPASTRFLHISAPNPPIPLTNTRAFLMLCPQHTHTIISPPHTHTTRTRKHAGGRHCFSVVVLPFLCLKAPNANLAVIYGLFFTTQLVFLFLSLL